jgi:hypothetical protein
MSAIIYDTTYSTTLVATACGLCGMPFGLPKDFRDRRLADHRTFFCPNGHRVGWTGKTSDQQALEAAQQQISTLQRDADHQRQERQRVERELIARKGHQARLKKRISAGVCPCCTRSFQNLRRHMAGEHPDYVEAATLGE